MRRSSLSFVFAVCIALPAVAQDPVKIDPAHHKVELENDYVRVLRITFGPGEKAPLHEHPDGVAVFLTDNQATVTPQGGSSDPTPRKRGEIIAAAASKHTVHNTGTSKSEVVLIELKEPPTHMLTQDAVKLDPNHYSVAHEDDRVRVLRIRYGPGEKSVMHGHWSGPVVNLSGGSMRFTDKTGKSIDQTSVADEVGWDAGEAHLPESLSDKPSEAILVELKPTAR